MSSVNINTSGFNIPDIAQAVSSAITSNDAKAETKRARAKRKEPIVQFREDNLDSSTEEALKNAIHSDAWPDTKKYDNIVQKLDNVAETKAEEKQEPEMPLLAAEQEPAAIKTKKAPSRAKKNDVTRKTASVEEESAITAALKSMETSKESEDEKIDFKQPLHEILRADMQEIGPEAVRLEDQQKDDVLKNKKLLVIQQYQNSHVFGAYLREMGVRHSIASLEHKSAKQLDDIITQIRVLCQNKSAFNGLDNILFNVTNAAESLAPYATAGKIDPRGMTEMLKQDTDFLEAWELVKLERFNFVNISPEARMAFSMLKCGYACHLINKMKSSGALSSGSAANMNIDPELLNNNNNHPVLREDSLSTREQAKQKEDSTMCAQTLPSL